MQRGAPAAGGCRQARFGVGGRLKEWPGSAILNISLTRPSLRDSGAKVRAGGRPAIQQLAAAVEERVKRSGRDVATVWVNEPGQHPLSFAIDAIVQIMAALSVLAVALSCFLVLTTITAPLAQQRRQIGVMKAIGARTRQIFAMYLVTVLAFGGLALLVALPLSGLGAALLADFLAGLMNFDPLAQGIPAGVHTASRWPSRSSCPLWPPCRQSSPRAAAPSARP